RSPRSAGRRRSSGAATPSIGRVASTEFPDPRGTEASDFADDRLQGHARLPLASTRPVRLGDNRRPMYALYEDAGKFHAGRVMSETESSLQIELASGKRAKVKAANVLLRFASPEPDALLGAAEQIAREVDLDLAWEFAPEGEFAFAELARDYFGAQA